VWNNEKAQWVENDHSEDALEKTAHLHAISIPVHTLTKKVSPTVQGGLPGQGKRR
jgi:hypothetical protein